MSDTVIHNKITGNLTYALEQMKAGKKREYIFKVDMPYGVRYSCTVGICDFGYPECWYTLKVAADNIDYEKYGAEDLTIHCGFTDEMIINAMADTIYKRMSMIRKEVKKMNNKNNEEIEEVEETMYSYDRIYNDILEKLKMFLDGISVLSRKRMTASIPGMTNMYAFETRSNRNYFEFSIYESGMWDILYSVDYAHGNVPVEKLAELFATTICNRRGIDIPSKPDYEQKYWDAQRDIDGYCREIDGYKKEILDLNKRLDIRDSAIKARDKTIEMLKAYKYEGCKEIEDLKKRNHAGAQQVDELYDQLRTEQLKHKKATEACKKQSQEIEDLKAQLKRVRDTCYELVAMARKCESLEKKDRELQNKIDELQEKIEVIKKVNGCLVDKINFAQKCVSGLVNNSKVFEDDACTLMGILEVAYEDDLTHGEPCEMGAC